MRSEPVRVAVWGVGAHTTKRILPALTACDAVELAGVTTRRADAGAAAVARHGGRVWIEPQAMLADPAVDAVYIATPTGVHDEHIAAALAAGKHVWCEKSLTSDPADAVRRIAQARAAGLALCEGFMFRHHPHRARVAELLPAIGAIASLGARFGIPHLDPGNFRYAQAQGGGALLDVGCYPLAAALALLEGPLEVVAADLIAAPGYEVDTEGWAVLRAAGGARAHLEWGYGLGYRNELSIWGRDGSLETQRFFSKLPDHAPVIDVIDRSGARRSEVAPALDAFVAMFTAFAATVADGEARRREWDDVLAQARLMAGVLAAARA
jgi:NDP-hexose-3-ketoreductase